MLITSQDTLIVITPQQLKTTNLIFVDHKRLIKENELLNLQINNYKEINYKLEQTDSLRQEQIFQYKIDIEDRNESIDRLTKSLNNKQKIIVSGGITSAVIIVLCLLLK